MIVDLTIPVASYRNGFGNWCSRIVAPKGQLQLHASAVVSGSGEPEAITPSGEQHAVQDRPQ